MQSPFVSFADLSGNQSSHMQRERTLGPELAAHLATRQTEEPIYVWSFPQGDLLPTHVVDFLTLPQASLRLP